MKRTMMWAIIALTMITTQWACSSDSDEISEPTPTICPVEPADTVAIPTTLTLTRSEQEMVNQSNQFAFRLFERITDPGCFGTYDGAKGIIISPLSITYALGMLNNGAAGETQQQINEVLGFGSQGADSINAFCYKMLKRGPAIDSLTRVLISNTIFLNKDYTLKTDFVNKARLFYEAEPETRDFHDGNTLNVINKWAADHTEQMIQKVLDESEFNPEAVSYLLNAIYFKGAWTCKFDKAETVQEPFKHIGNTEDMTYCQMMHQRRTFNYGETDDYQILQLPYGNQSFNMTILLPKGQTNSMPKIPTAEQWTELNRRLFAHLVDVKLPCFESETKLRLNDIMCDLGMPNAFSDRKADFRYFADRPTFIGLMKQAAKIKVNEEGTEAAAVTVIGMETTSLGEPLHDEYIAFHANHPFLYVISEKTTGAVYFIGVYTGY